MQIRALERKIEAARQEISRLEADLIEKRAFLQGLQEAQKLFPKSPQIGKGETVLRAGSDMAKARDFLRSTGRPIHITDILTGIGKENTKQNRLSVSSSLAGYARRGEIFTKSGPNTFGLVDMEISSPDGASGAIDSSQTFGSIEVANDNDIPF
ncbi:MAG: hypothetical protein KBD94_06340 [Pyrinomonadaceae bacterium]|nr:hypothetical protein [Pyrinomonadaceae bacterium]